MRLKGRFIRRTDVFKAIDRGEIIEAYPDDKYLPSYLLMGQLGRKVIHVVAAVDIEENHIRIVTAYPPDPNEWEAGFRKRRKKQ